MSLPPTPPDKMDDGYGMMIEILDHLPAKDRRELEEKIGESAASMRARWKKEQQIDAARAQAGHPTPTQDDNMTTDSKASAAPTKRRHLGRGLGALLGEVAVPVAVPAADTSASSPQAPELPTRLARSEAAPHTVGSPDRTRLPVDKLSPGPFQPRRIFNDEALDELAQSIREKGVLQPILARAHPQQSGHYQIIGGERRWRAAQKAGLHEVPVILRDFSDSEAMEAAIIENVQRQDLTPLEEAEGFNRLLTEFGHTHEDLAKALGKSRAHVTNAVRLLKLPKRVREALESGEITAGHARVLVAVDDPQALLNRILAEHLSVRKTEDYARAGATSKPKREGKGTGITLKNPNVLALEKELTTHLGLKVQILSHGQSGTLMIKYTTLDQLEPVLEKLRSEG